MFDLQKELDRRLAALKLAEEGKTDPQYADIDVSKEGIKKTLINAGILDSTGKMKALEIE